MSEESNAVSGRKVSGHDGPAEAHKMRVSLIVCGLPLHRVCMCVCVWVCVYGRLSVRMLFVFAKMWLEKKRKVHKDMSRRRSEEEEALVGFWGVPVLGS